MNNLRIFNNQKNNSKINVGIHNFFYKKKKIISFKYFFYNESSYLNINKPCK